MSQIYTDTVHQVKSIRKLVNKQRLIQDATDDSADWSSISCQVHGIDASFNKLLEDYDAMQEQANNTRCLIRSLGGHPVEPPVLLSEHPSSLLSKNRRSSCRRK